MHIKQNSEICATLKKPKEYIGSMHSEKITALGYLYTSEGIFSLIIIFSSYLFRSIWVTFDPFINYIVSIFMGLFISNQILKYFSINKCRKYIGEKTHEVAIIIGEDNILTKLFFSDCLGIGYLIDYLKLEGKKFNIYITPSKKDFESLLKNKDIRRLYLIGHGRKRLFVLNSEDLIVYSDYKSSKIIKDEIHLYHCGNGDGKTLIDYLVKKENRKKCYSTNSKTMVLTDLLKFRESYLDALKTHKKEVKG